MTPTFQRARRPEQMAARRTAILDAARAALAEKNLAEISLRELGDRVGLAKSNLLRYFDSREAIFLEVLDGACQAWVSRLDAALGAPQSRKPLYSNETRVATAMADTIAEEPLLCELLSAMASVLERNISAGTARDFKVRAMGNIGALAEVVARHLPWLPAGSAAAFAEGALMLVAGMYPFAVPTDPVRDAMAEMGMPDPRDRFADGLRDALVSWLVGAAARAESGPV